MFFLIINAGRGRTDMPKICSVEGCNNDISATHGAKGMCGKHYMRWKTHGDANILLRAPEGLAKSHPEEHRAWCSMRNRCYNKNDANYKRYGDRGITVCDRWLGPNGFVNFLEDMGEKPTYAKFASGKPLYSLDRIDNNGPYAPENCRWATAKEQANNRRPMPNNPKRKNNINVEWSGETHSLKEWSRLLDINYGTLYMRYASYGWRGDKLFMGSQY